MTGYARPESDYSAADRFRRDARPASLAPKDYSVPLHVDCSIEYELPDCAKPPQGVKIEPLLMIHPSHFRRLESLRRVPFVNNLPRGDVAAATAVTPGSRARATRPARRCCRAAPAPAAPAPQPQPAQHVRQHVRPHEEAAGALQARALACYRFESFAPEVAGGGKALRARLKPHPYLPAEALDCDIARALPPAAHYDRFDKRALQQLPIYM